MDKKEKRNNCSKLQESKVFRVTDNCTVNLKSTSGNGCKKVRISTVNGYDKYAFLIGKQKGNIVRCDGSFLDNRIY